MIEEQALQALVSYSGDGPVLSVYLDTDLTRNTKDAVKLMLRDCVKDLTSADDEVRAVEHYLDFDYDWQAPGLAVFAADQAFWKTMPLPIAVPSQAVWAAKPYIRPLVDIMDRLSQYSIALIDRESVRLFLVSWGRITSETEAFGEELKRHKQGGWAAARYQRHEDNLALHNLKQAVEVIQAFCERAGCERLMLAGKTEVLAQVKELLPKAVRAQIIGEFAADMAASPNELLSRSRDIAAQADAEEERKQVAEAVTAAAKGGAGVIGLADTLYALHQGSVRQLLVNEDYRAAGHVCTHCGYISADEIAACPFCGHEEIEATPDIVNRAIQKALQTGAGINIVRGNEDLAAVGGIAAILRYG